MEKALFGDRQSIFCRCSCRRSLLCIGSCHLRGEDVGAKPDKTERKEGDHTGGELSWSSNSHTVWWKPSVRQQSLPSLERFKWPWAMHDACPQPTVSSTSRSHFQGTGTIGSPTNQDYPTQTSPAGVPCLLQRQALSPIPQGRTSREPFGQTLQSTSSPTKTSLP